MIATVRNQSHLLTKQVSVDCIQLKTLDAAAPLLEKRAYSKDMW